MNITVEVLTPAIECFKSARQTQGMQFEKITPSVKTWISWLHAEHSPIRVMQLRINMTFVPYYIAMHLRTHTEGIMPFVRSQRDTAISPVDYDRRKAPQNAPVDYCPVLNPQSLINISRRRLCRKADKDTIEVWKEVKRVIENHPDDYVAAIAPLMMPYCEYRGDICHEINSCGLYPNWKDCKVKR